MIFDDIRNTPPGFWPTNVPFLSQMRLFLARQVTSPLTLRDAKLALSEMPLLSIDFDVSGRRYFTPRHAAAPHDAITSVHAAPVYRHD